MSMLSCMIMEMSYYEVRYVRQVVGTKGGVLVQPGSQ